MILIYSKTGTLDIASINALADSGAEAGMFAFNGLLIGQTAMTLFGLGLIAGAVGKSAQFPLHIWLPDAMEGPTPVSALVHSATMVAAGVYLLARFFPVIHASSTASDLIAWIGAGRRWARRSWRWCSRYQTSAGLFDDSRSSRT